VRVILFTIVIVLVCRRAKLNLFDNDGRLFLFRLVLLLLLLVLVLAEVNDATNRRLRLRRNLDQIQSALARDLKGLLRAHHSKLFTLVVNYANLRPANTFVNAYGDFRLIAALWPATSEKSTADKVTSWWGKGIIPCLYLTP